MAAYTVGQIPCYSEITNPQALLQSGKKLIALQSTEQDHDEALGAVVDFMVAILQKQPKITIERFAQNGKPSLLAYVGSQRPQRFKVLLNAHLDVVPGNANQFDMREAEGRLYGRGALDMKLAALVMTEAFVELAPRVDYPLGIQLVTDEEAGGYDGTLHQIEQGVAADLMIAGESTNLDICIMSRGLCRVRLGISGRTAHSAYLWKGDNAALHLMDDIRKILEVYPVPGQEVWRTTVNVSRISAANQAINQVPAAATAELDIRTVTTDENFKSPEAVRAFFKRIDPALKVEIIGRVEPPHQADERNPILAVLVKAVQQTTGNQPAFIRKHGAADIRFFGSAAIAFGPVGDHIHGDDEYVTIRSLQDYDVILRSFLQSVT